MKYVTLSNDEREIRWRDEKESVSYSSITLNSIRDVTIGYESDVFAAIPGKDKAGTEMTRPWFCFSIVCEDRSLDLSVKNGSLQRREDVSSTVPCSRTPAFMHDSCTIHARVSD